LIAGGAALFLSGCIGLLGAFHVRAGGYFFNNGPATISALLLLGAVIVLAIGLRGETGIVGSSTLGKVALIVFGARGLVLVGFTIVLAGASLPVAQVINDCGTVVFVAAGAVASIVVVRKRVLQGVSRWVLLAVAAGFGIVLLPTLLGSVEILRSLSGVGATVVMPLLVVALGVIYVVHGAILQPTASPAVPRQVRSST